MAQRLDRKSLSGRGSVRKNESEAESPMKQRIRDLLKSVDLVPTRHAPFFVRLHPYTGDGRMRKWLGRELSEPRIWEAADSAPVGQLGEVFVRTGGGHKWIHYLPIYESVIDSSRPIRMLEIGVFRGGSLRMWREYLHPESVVVGIDINTDCGRFDDPSNNVHVRIGSQDDAGFLHEVAAEFGPFDVIIDDGSHLASHMIESFRQLFSSALVDGGSFVVEDLHANYWKPYRDSAISFIDFLSVLIDAMHAHYHESESEQYFRTGNAKRMHSVTVPWITPMLESIQIFDSIAVIKKHERALPRTVLQ